jgi:hypothetical protein
MDPLYLSILVQAEKKFWRCVQSGDLPQLPRMADFALWATACETALWPAGTFARAYAANRRAAVGSLKEADPVTTCVRELMAERSSGSVAPPICCGSAPIAATTASRGLGPAGPKIPARLPAACGARRHSCALGIEVAFSREGRAGSRVIRIRETTDTTVSTGSSVPDNESQPGSRQPLPGPSASVVDLIY